MNPADFLAAKVYTGSKNIALIGKSQEFGMGDVYEPGSKTFTLLGSRSFPCLSMGWGCSRAADLAGARHEVVTAEQEMVLAAPQVILNPNIRYANAARTPYEAKVWRLDAPVGENFQ